MNKLIFIASITLLSACDNGSQDLQRPEKAQMIFTNARCLLDRDNKMRGSHSIIPILIYRKHIDNKSRVCERPIVDEKKLPYPDLKKWDFLKNA